MSTRPTDAVSAALVVLIVWTVGRRSGRTPRELLRPSPFVAGLGAAVVMEVGIARWPERTRRLWRYQIVRFGSPSCLVGAVLVSSRRFGAVPFAVALGGIVGYFSLLVGIVSGVVPEPETWFENRRIRG